MVLFGRKKKQKPKIGLDKINEPPAPPSFLSGKANMELPSIVPKREEKLSPFKQPKESTVEKKPELKITTLFQGPQSPRPEVAKGHEQSLEIKEKKELELKPLTIETTKVKAKTTEPQGMEIPISTEFPRISGKELSQALKKKEDKSIITKPEPTKPELEVTPIFTTPSPPMQKEQRTVTQKAKEKVKTVMASKIEEEPVKELAESLAKPVFIEAEDYKKIVDDLKSIKAELSTIDELAKSLTALKKNNLSLLERWRSGIVQLEKKVMHIDEKLFKEKIL